MNVQPPAGWALPGVIQRCRLLASRDPCTLLTDALGMLLVDYRILQAQTRWWTVGARAYVSVKCRLVNDSRQLTKGHIAGIEIVHWAIDWHLNTTSTDRTKGRPRWMSGQISRIT